MAVRRTAMDLRILASYQGQSHLIGGKKKAMKAYHSRNSNASRAGPFVLADATGKRWVSKLLPKAM